MTLGVDTVHKVISAVPLPNKKVVGFDSDSGAFLPICRVRLLPRTVQKHAHAYILNSKLSVGCGSESEWLFVYMWPCDLSRVSPAFTLLHSWNRFHYCTGTLSKSTGGKRVDGY